MESEKIERLRDRMLQCPICIDEYKDPRILTCHHSVCLNCLLEYVQASSSSGRLFRCPQCRADVCVPRGGVKNFPPNFYINCIQDEIGSKPYFGICDICERDWLVSQYRCIDCDLDICKFCVHDHRLFKHMSGRQSNIIRIETGNIGANLTAQKSCPEHKEEPLCMFCNTCNAPICVQCVCDNHKKHDTTTLAKKLALDQKNLQFDLDRLHIDIKEVKTNLEKLRDLEKLGEKSADEAICQIQDHSQQVIQTVCKLADEKINAIKAKKGRHVKEIRDYETELSGYLDQLQRGNNFLNDLQEEDLSLEMIECFRKYNAVLESAKKSVINKQVAQDSFSFKPGKVFSKFGCLLVERGVLKDEKKTVCFMERKKKGHRVIAVFKEKLSFTKLLAACVVICILIGFYLLGRNLAEKFDLETAICLGFYGYLSLAGIAAYWKSSMSS